MDRVVANVNGEIILLSDVRKRIELVKRLAGPDEGAIPPGRLSERAVLSSMVDEKVIAHYAKESNVTVKESEVDQAIDRVLEGNSITYDQLEQALKAQGMSMEDYREKMREQMLTRKISSLEVTGVNVTEEEARAYYERNRKMFLDPPEEKIRASHIVLLASPEGDPENYRSAKRKIRELLEEIKNGADFAHVAKKESQDGAAKNGGDLGWFTRGTMVPAFEEAAFALEKGEVGGPVATRYGFHLIMVTDRIKPKPAPFEKVREKVLAVMSEEAFRKKRDAWLERLRSQAYIEILY